MFKRALIAAACLSTVLSSAARADDVELYGLVDMFTGSQTAPGGNRAWVSESGAMSTSYWGMKGSEDLGGGLQAVFALEGFFLANTGAAGRFTGDDFFARNSYVGVVSPTWGTVTVGRLTTEAFLSTIIFNPFVDSFTFSPIVLHTFIGVNGQGLIGDSGWNNAVQYQSTSFGGFSANAMFSFGDSTDFSQHKWSAGASYYHGPLGATVVYQDVKYNNVADDLTPGMTGQNAVQAGVSYDFGVVKLYGQYMFVNNSINTGNLKVNTGSGGFSVPLGGGAILADYAYSKSNGAATQSRSTFAVGYDYHLSKRTDVYAAYLYDKVTDESTGQTYGVGIRSMF
nr:porin [Pararobbsia silviterrae]